MPVIGYLIRQGNPSLTNWIKIGWLRNADVVIGKSLNERGFGMPGLRFGVSVTS